jgi:hypothetical protein
MSKQKQNNSRFGQSKNNSGSSNNRFGSNRFGQSNKNNSSNNNSSNNNNQPQPQSRFGGRPNPFSQTQQLNWVLSPMGRKIVRFELSGLGDPFYRLLGHDINTDYADSRAVARALEVGGEHVEAIKQMLDDAWEGYKLNGAILVYTWKARPWANIARPVPTPNNDPADWLEDLDDDDKDENTEKADDNAGKEKKEPPPAFDTLRSMDLMLALNVLARSRSQLLLANAPLVFSQQYLNRSLVIDDPRLIALAQATGSIKDA